MEKTVKMIDGVLGAYAPTKKALEGKDEEVVVEQPSQTPIKRHTAAEKRKFDIAAKKKKKAGNYGHESISYLGKYGLKAGTDVTDGCEAVAKKKAVKTRRAEGKKIPDYEEETFTNEED